MASRQGVHQARRRLTPRAATGPGQTGAGRSTGLAPGAPDIGRPHPALEWIEGTTARWDGDTGLHPEGLGTFPTWAAPARARAAPALVRRPGRRPAGPRVRVFSGSGALCWGSPVLCRG